MYKFNFPLSILRVVISSLLCGVLHIFTSYAETFQKEIAVNFNISDFEISERSDTISIASKKHIFKQDENSFQPGVPLIGISVATPMANKLVNYSYNYTNEHTILNVAAIHNAPIFSTSGETLYDNTASLKYNKPLIQHTGSMTIGNYTLHNFLVSPFSHDNKKKEVHFANSFALTLELKEIIDDTTISRSSNSQTPTNSSQPIQPLDMPLSFIQSIVINKNDIATDEDFNLPINKAANETVSSIIDNHLLDVYPSKHAISDKIDYLIITSNSLANKFSPLLKWKRQKGLSVFIETVDAIKKQFPQYSTLYAIKQYIMLHSQQHSLKYVLLGGDDTIIPTAMCASGSARDSIVPSDLYYACFNRCLDWDFNRNGILAEPADSADLTPSVFVSRLPVRTPQEVENSISKILAYEKDPLKYPWNNNMLLCGYNLARDSKDYPNLTEKQSNILWDQYISPYWNGSPTRFYDTFTDFPDGADYEFSKENLQEQLSKGYSFISVNTHGAANAFELETWPAYKTTEASELSNNGFSILTTGACMTNNFTSIEDPCLSESFIRNKNSGIIAYYGSSYNGYFTHDTTKLGPSLQYEAMFYKYLFSNSLPNKNLSAVINASKIALLPLIGPYKFDFERNVHLGLNAIGDPETPIHTQKPTGRVSLNFKQPLIENEYNCVKVKIGLGHPGEYNICLMTVKMPKLLYYATTSMNVQKNLGVKFNNVNFHQYGVATWEYAVMSLCVTKENCGTFIQYFMPDLYLQNYTYDHGALAGDQIHIGENVTTSTSPGEVIFKSTTSIVGKCISINDGTTIEKDATITISNVTQEEIDDVGANKQSFLF